MDIGHFLHMHIVYANEIMIKPKCKRHRFSWTIFWVNIEIVCSLSNFSCQHRRHTFTNVNKQLLSMQMHFENVVRIYKYTQNEAILIPCVTKNRHIHFGVIRYPLSQLDNFRTLMGLSFNLLTKIYDFKIFIVFLFSFCIFIKETNFTDSIEMKGPKCDLLRIVTKKKKENSICW